MTTKKEWEKLRRLALERCQGYCERCSLPLNTNFALHHRLLRSRGGRDEIQNLVALHHHCHNIGTDSVHLNPAEATRRGLMVPSGSDPLEVAVVLEGGHGVLLTEDGSYLVSDWSTDAW